jgi:hypothetical protein
MKLWVTGCSVILSAAKDLLVYFDYIPSFPLTKGTPLRRLLVLSLAGSATLTFGAEQQRPLESARSLGRGNTYVAAYDSDDATRSNPATLSETDIIVQLRWAQLDLFVGENAIDAVNDLTSFSAEDSATGALDAFKEKFGKRIYGRAQLNALATRVMWFELMPFATTSNYVEERVPSIPEFEFHSDTMAGVAMAFGYALGKNYNLGVTLRPAHRTVFAGKMAFADLLDFVEAEDMALEDYFEKREGFQIGMDVGGIWKPTKEWRFGATVENLGYAGNFSEFEDPPSPYPQKLSLGMNYRWDLKPWHWDFSADLQDVINPHQYDWWRLLHLGTEIGSSYISRDHDVGLMLGINEGYFSGGVFVDVFVARLTISSYAVELGEYAGQRGDRRWGASLSSTMTF